ncbi:MAG: hypothetical protein HYS98_08030 [Deltaproteobacteria bacterium]|nr:hypothetical protein [Deltaproteobacteria bacterium]
MLFSSGSLALIAFALGCMLMLKVCPPEKCCKKFMTFCAGLIMLLSFLALLCAGFKWYKYKKSGYHHSMEMGCMCPKKMHDKEMMHDMKEGEAAEPETTE